MSKDLEHWSSPNGCHEDCPACDAEEEWKQEVACDNTRLGLVEWAEHTRESDAKPQHKCPTCGRMNFIVNQCGCDPSNLPTTVPTRLTMEQRGKLARDVFATVFDECETFTEDDVGKDLAYLMGAILDDTEKVDCHVDWTTEIMGTKPKCLVILERVYSEASVVWKFIIKDP